MWGGKFVDNVQFLLCFCCADTGVRGYSLYVVIKCVFVVSCVHSSEACVCVHVFVYTLGRV